MRGVFTLFLHRLRPEHELVASAAARLRAVPENLAAGRANLRPELVPELLLNRAINQARAGANYTQFLLPAEVAEEHRAPLVEAGAVAAAAFEEFAEFLEEMRPAAKGDWAFGEDRYNAVLQQAEMLSFDARALRERAREQITELTAALRAGARELAGHENWHDLLLDLNKDRPQTPEEMRKGYEEWTERARALPQGARAGQLPAGGGVPGRPVGPLPASGAGGRLVRIAAELRGDDGWPLLRPLPARRRQRGGGRQAAGVELISQHPHHGGPRGVPRPPLAPGHGQGQPLTGPAAVRDQLLRGGLGARTRSG